MVSLDIQIDCHVNLAAAVVADDKISHLIRSLLMVNMAEVQSYVT